jgi:flavin reductase (DIM6/NTAB) family NADH-FMN oxidoreductase RutF
MVTPELFRQVLGNWGSGVAIVSTVDDAGAPYGLTVSSFNSVSLDPPLVLVCLDNRLTGLAHFGKSKKFGVSILAESQEEVSRIFAKRGVERPSSAFATGATGIPLVRDALAGLECAIEATYPGGDHTILLGRVEALSLMAASTGAKPLLYFRGRYERIP